MREAVIVSTARTPIGKAYRGSFNDLEGPSLAAFPINAVVARSEIDPGEIEDVILGCALTQGSTGINVARHAVLAAGMPNSVPGQTIDRQCASGLSAIVAAANQIVHQKQNVVIGGGLDSISLVQNEHMNMDRYKVPLVEANQPDYYYTMIQTAEIVAEKYGVSRDTQDEYALSSQQKTAAAQENNLLLKEIVPVKAVKKILEKHTGEVSYENILLNHDECNRPGTQIEQLQKLKPVMGEGHTVTAGNASQLSDGASASLLMEAKVAEKRGIDPMGCIRGMVVVGCNPGEMGIGPVFAISKLLEQQKMSISDIGLWEINEAFAAQLVYCKDELRIPDERLNVNGGAIAIGHPYGMSGARMVGHVLYEAKRRKEKYAVVSMCIGGGQGAAALIEVY